MWIYENVPIISMEEIADDTIGFVYEITNLVNGRKYIGKKLLTMAKTKVIKGKKKKIRSESTWKSYYGSNQELIDDVKKFGKENFKREILRFCTSKGEMSYWEARLQFDNNVLESDMYYNQWISCRIHKKHLTYLKR